MRTVPWGTPDFTRSDSEELPSTTTLNPNFVMVKFVQEALVGENIRGLNNV